MSLAGLTADVPADLLRGFGQPVEDIAIAELVMMPFVLTLVILLGWMFPLPSLVAMVLFVALILPAAFWNAGWRARTAA